MALPTPHPLLKEQHVRASIADSSAATSGWTVAPFRCKVVKLYAVGDAVVDSDRVITGKIAGTAITGGAITMTASGSAAGTVFSATPTGANIANEGDNIEFASDGAGSTACVTSCMAVLQAI